MDRVTLYADAGPEPRALKLRPFASEAALRRFAERHLETALGLRLVASEVPVDGWAAGRIDALAVDEHLRPVVLEFKREATGTAIGQALAYVDWLLAHRDKVTLIVARQLGITVADRLDWSAPRLLCIAEAFGPREEAVARQLGNRVELVRIVRYATKVFAIQRI